MRRDRIIASLLTISVMLSACSTAAETEPSSVSVTTAGTVAVPTVSESTSDTVQTSEAEPFDCSSYVEEMAVLYANDPSGSEESINAIMDGLRQEDPVLASKWERIFGLWRDIDTDTEVNFDELPDGLPQTDELCLVVLGFALNDDGSIREELVRRLQVALVCAEEYPNAVIVCTGGPTARNNPEATEAGRMAEWLTGHGVDESRIVVEDRSLSTSQNAVNTYEILMRQYPQVSQIAIISSDYHIATARLVFTARSILLSEGEGEGPYTVVSNAACYSSMYVLSRMFQAGALIELAGDPETANDIYLGIYDPEN